MTPEHKNSNNSWNFFSHRPWKLLLRVKGMNFDAFLATFLLVEMCNDANMQVCLEDKSLSFAIFAMQIVLSLRHCACNVAVMCYKAGFMYNQRMRTFEFCIYHCFLGGKAENKKRASQEAEAEHASISIQMHTSLPLYVMKPMREPAGVSALHQVIGNYEIINISVNVGSAIFKSETFRIFCRVLLTFWSIIYQNKEASLLAY